MGHRSVILEGRYYDGAQSRGKACRMEVAVHGQVCLVDSGLATLSIAEIRIPSRLGNTARQLQLPGGGVFETEDNDTVDQLEQAWFGDHRGLVSRLESNLKIALASVVVVLLAGYFFVTLGLPALSQQVVGMMPLEVDRELGATALPQLDNRVFEPTELADERKAALVARFDNLLDDTTFDYRLEFRKGAEMGANALALPGGIIVLTDELVELAGDDDMLAAVMLHEIGHVEHRHGVQALTRQAALSALILAVTGDVNTASSLVILLPTVLLQASYSRDFEQQADGFALEQMQQHGINPAKFAAMLQRLSEDSTSESEGWRTYLQTHPASRDRIARFETANN